MSIPSNASNVGHSPLSALWEEMLDDFRALGGVAENVILAHGDFGRGLFPRDPAQPFSLKLPDNLLFPVEDVEFVDNRIRVREAAVAGTAERDFLERYESAFSWGGGGEVESSRFIAEFDALPPEVLAILTGGFGMGYLLEGDHAERTRKRFLESRMVRWHDRNVLMPLIDLANCGADGVAYSGDEQGRLQIEGTTQGEILVNYGPHDSFDIFRTFGFATPRPRAYSLPMKAKVGARDLNIGWDMAARTKRWNVWTPEMTLEGNEISLSHLLVGNAKAPRLSRGIFYALMREAGATAADNAFDFILYTNRRRFLDLLEVLEPHTGEMIARLRSMAHFQLEALAHCVGTREL